MTPSPSPRWRCTGACIGALLTVVLLLLRRLNHRKKEKENSTSYSLCALAPLPSPHAGGCGRPVLVALPLPLSAVSSLFSLHLSRSLPFEGFGSPVPCSLSLLFIVHFPISPRVWGTSRAVFSGLP